jgi:alpha-aminoadipic semialdehyde synthase
LLTTRFNSVPISNILNFEGIANRDSYPYGPAYGLPSGIRTLLRGTLRYPGYCDLVQSFKQIGLLNTQPLAVSIASWADLVPQALATKGIQVRSSDHASVQAALSDLVPSNRTEALLDALRWLGLLPPSIVSDLPPISGISSAPIDHLAAVLAHKLRYGPDERDLVVLSHEIIARPQTAGPGAQEEIHTSQLVTYGTSTASAMSRTVGLPVAFATLQILDGKVSARGVQGP